MSLSQKSVSPYFEFPTWQAVFIVVAQMLPFIFGNFSALENVAPLIFFVAFIYAAARDWHGLSTLRGIADTAHMGKNLKWYIFAYIMLFPIFIIIYDIRMVIDSFQSERIREQKAALALKENILRLERELGIGQNMNTEEDRHN